MRSLSGSSQLFTAVTEKLTGSAHGPVDVLIGMGRRNERTKCECRLDIDALAQHPALVVALQRMRLVLREFGDVAEALDGAIGEVEAPNRTALANLHLQREIIDAFLDSVTKSLTERIEPLMNRLIEHYASRSH